MTLLDAVDRLTKPYTVTVYDIHGNAAVEDGRTVRAEQPARLTQLHDAIHPSGNRGGSGSAKSERALIDSGALEQWSQYRDRINTAARSVDVTPDSDPAVTLRRWYVEVAARTLTDSYSDEWETRLNGWARAIDRRLSPAYTFEVTAPCPECGETRAIDKATGLLGTAVLASAWRTEGGGPVEINTVCRFCGSTWDGMDGARYVRYEMDKQEVAA